jgi:hypothetical protein
MAEWLGIIWRITHWQFRTVHVCVGSDILYLPVGWRFRALGVFMDWSDILVLPIGWNGRFLLGWSSVLVLPIGWNMRTPQGWSNLFVLPIGWNVRTL